MTDLFDNFRFVPNGRTTLADALSGFIKEEIAFGRIKGGDKLPTIGEISEATGLTFAQARRVTESLAREGYVHSRPHSGTFALSRDGNVMRGRVIMALPDVDTSRFYPTQLIATISRKLTMANYAVSVTTFALDGHDGLAHLKGELLRPTDLVLAMRATPQVQKCLAEAGVNHFFAYGDKPKASGAPWIRFSAERAVSDFADHCVKAGVKRVVQVRLEGNELNDAQSALAKRGIDCSWLTIPRGEGCRWSFDGAIRRTYETFEDMPRNRIPDLLLFWNAFVAQGAIIAFLARGIRLPEDVNVVTLSNTGLGPLYTKSLTRIESDPVEAGEKVADFAITMLAKGRVPRPPKISPRYVFGETFPF